MTKLPNEIKLSGRGKARELNCLVMQSPLAGVSDQIFRSLIRRWAPNALLFTEMVNATSIELGHGLCKLEEIETEKGPIGVQLFDNRPSAMAEAARRAEASGAFLIDINMGCPVRKVAYKGRGSGLIQTPDLAAEIVTKVANAVQIPVTVKTRLGWSTKSYDPIGFALKLESAGAQMITLHGRTREQGFTGESDWNAIAAVKKKLNIPLIANGDIDSPHKALQCLTATKADGIMIGRGSMGAPWLIGQINATIKNEPVIQTPTPKERILLAREQLEALVRVKGEHGLLIARKHLKWTCKGFPGDAKLRNQLMRAQSLSKAIELLEKQENLLD